ncbi:hypothetical protein LR002_00520, partial [Candidatus Gracilibacteria bacterium]|nr:hypothetical protein [Candidatus Gracilibacteria bacterium]
MKKFLLTLVGIFIFGISSEIFAQNITRYSDYGEDWTLDKQLFDLGDASIDLDTYKTNTFKVAILSGSTCQTGGNFAEYGENFQGLGRIEISSNNETEATYWKFKPGKKFAKLNNEDFVEFCYGTGTNLDSRIKIKKSSKGDVLKMVGEGTQQKVVLSKSIGDFGSNVEVSLRCEPNDIDYNSIITGENDEKFVISLKKLDLKVNNSSIKAIVEDGQDTSVEDSDVNESFNTYFFVKANNFNVNFEYVINSNNTSISNTDTSTSDTDISNDPNISPSVSQSNLITSTLSSLDIFLTNHPDFLEMYLYKGTLSKYEDIFDTENHPLVAQGKGLALSTNLDITDVDSYSLVSKIRGSVSSPNIKVYSFSKGEFTSKLYTNDFKITFTDGANQIDNSTVTKFIIETENITPIFQFNP